jgi:hypothetical protein
MTVNQYMAMGTKTNHRPSGIYHCFVERPLEFLNSLTGSYEPYPNFNGLKSYNFYSYARTIPRSLK